MADLPEGYNNILTDEFIKSGLLVKTLLYSDMDINHRISLGPPLLCIIDEPPLLASVSNVRLLLQENANALSYRPIGSNPKVSSVTKSTETSEYFAEYSLQKTYKSICDLVNEAIGKKK